MSEEIKKEEGIGNEEELVREEEAPHAEEEAGAPSEEDALKARIAELEEEIASLKDKALRDAADTDNYKKRLRQEKENAVRYANEGLVKDLLDPLDNFSRAIESAGDAETIKKGVEMVEDQFVSVLKRWGLESFNPKGVPFNPETMEACMMEESEDVETDTVSQVFLKGYRLSGKIIRPAKVVVSKPKKKD